MKLATVLVYWVIVLLWAAVLVTVATAYVRNRRGLGPLITLLAVVAIDTFRNIVENIYFGLYFGATYGALPSGFATFLGDPHLLILPKVMNVIAACVVLGVLLLTWMPNATQQRAEVDADIRKKSDALRQESEDRRRLFETSLDLILITDRRGTLLQVSPSAEKILGRSPAEMSGQSARDFIFPDDLDATRDEMRKARAGRATRNFETRYVHKDGHPVTLAWSGVWSEPEQKHFFTGRDISDRKTVERQLNFLAHYDPLTRLRNRFSLQLDLKTSLDGLENTSIAMFDLDGFKDINDTLGHSIGDKLLEAVADRMRQAENDSTRVYRLGGDEFVLVRRQCGDPIEISSLINSMLRQVAERYEVSGHILFVGASAGIAIAPAHGNDVEEIMSRADLALYDAKAAGGNTYRLFLPNLLARASARRQLDADLRRACSHSEFELYYQPQIRSEDGSLAGAEALIRWHHPDRGILYPDEFIEALSESAAALEVGRWIVLSACKQAARWRSLGSSSFRMGVNLFPAQFNARTLYDDVESALHEAGLPAESLEIEITENIALGDDNLESVRALREKGVTFAFDDFGTGYASLSYLTRYPLNRIKIDRSFIRRISNSATSEETAIVRSIIAMAHNLGLGVIAEGVEDEYQAAFLRRQKCEEQQGYLHGKPMPANEFESRYLGHACESNKPTHPRDLLKRNKRAV